MADEYDPAAPYGWFGEGENRRPHQYPPLWWYEPGHLDRVQQHPPPLPQPQPPSIPPAPAAQSQATLQSQQQQQKQPQQLQQQPQQLQQQQQQAPPHRPRPTFSGPGPGQVLDRHDRFFGCLHCQWTGDRGQKARDHVLRDHPGVPAQESQGYVDWGMCRPRYR